MKHLQIKVCGITELEEALIMESWGVQYLGFNFVQSSKRYISPAKAAEIISEISPNTKCVGVFVNPSEGFVRSMIEQSGIDSLQFHGEESPELLNQFKDFYRIKVFSVTNQIDLNLVESFNDSCEAYLFDAKIGDQVGGTGQVFDWNLIQSLQTDKPIFLAGGLGPHNCVAATQQTHCDVLDLNSKIEKSPGKKDLNLLNQCLESLQQAKLLPKV